MVSVPTLHLSHREVRMRAAWFPSQRHLLEEMWSRTALDVSTRYYNLLAMIQKQVNNKISKRLAHFDRLTLANSHPTSSSIHALAFSTKPAASNRMHVSYLKKCRRDEFNLCIFKP
jgi:hypothetical protein